VQVTKLCDLGIDDLVCSVGWAQRGTHLAVGTSNGKVQVRVYAVIASVSHLRIRIMGSQMATFFFVLNCVWGLGFTAILSIVKNGAASLSHGN